METIKIKKCNQLNEKYQGDIKKMEKKLHNTTEPQHDAKLPVMRGAFCWAVTGTFHGSIIEAETEGEARRIFHKHYNGESITHIKKRNVPAWAF